MATLKKITKKIIPQSPVPSGTGQDSVKEEKSTSRVARECFFCQKKSNPLYTDLTNLRRHLTDRAKIVSKERSGVCSKHQRAVAKNIKYARHLALLPFVPKV